MVANEAHFRNDPGAILKMAFSLSFLLLLCFVSKSRGLYVDVPSDEVHFLFFLSPALCKKKNPCYHFNMDDFYCFRYQHSVKHYAPLIV